MSLNDEPGKFGKITVNIEDVDESWALKLLNESEHEDYWITVQNEESSGHFKHKELSLINDHPQLATQQSHDDKSFINLNHDQDPNVLSLSAIEYQLLEQKQRDQELRDKSRQNLKKTRVSLSRIKAFFVA